MTRPRGDRGSGLIASSLGVTFFLVFLLVATQVAAHLAAAATARADAAQAVRSVASAEVSRTGTASAIEAREAQRLRLKWAALDPSLAWDRPTSVLVTLDLVLRSPADRGVIGWALALPPIRVHATALVERP